MNKVKRLTDEIWKGCRHRYVVLVCRLAVGTTFIISGATKLPEQAVFVEEVKTYNILSDGQAEIFGNALPWVEVIIGSLLILGLLSRLVGGIGFLTALSLVIANSIVLYRGVNMDCGCFGDLVALQTRDAIIIDSVLLIMTLLILFRKSDYLSLDSLIFKKKSTENMPEMQ